MGLGSVDIVPLARARQLAADARVDVVAGRDPIEERKSARKASQHKKTFGEVADALIEAKASAWRNPKHRAQWVMTLTIYAAPLRSVAVDEIDTEAVLSVLQPLWQSKPETASRLRGRIEAVLDAARVRGYTPAHQANPARWRGHLDALLPKRHKLTRGHHAAMAYDAVPRFIARLRERESMAALALEFTILTAARSGEVLGAAWSEIDTDKKVWTIPAERMNNARPHPRARNLDEAPRGQLGRLHLYRNEAGKAPVGNGHGLRRMKVERCTPHGFRSSFRDWAGNELPFPREVQAGHLPDPLVGEPG
jgi:integrase